MRIFMKKVYLILENGEKFEGYRAGAEGQAVGEVVFTTSMGGYLETLADPAYFGQIVVQTFPLIGNYGDIPEDYDASGIRLAGYVCREICDSPSNFRCEGKFEDVLKKNNVVCICGVDTRRLAKTIRENGVMNGIITDEENLSAETRKFVREYTVKGAVEATSCKQIKKYGEDNNGISVAVMDYGQKDSIVKEFVRRGCKVTCYPHDTGADKVLADKPDAIVLSDGAGNPQDNGYEIAQIAKLFESKIPMLAISLGHQMLAISQGAKTYKLKYGHRGGNQPVKEAHGERIYITGQNHGYVVDNNALPSNAKLCYINANDGTCEGLDYGHAVSYQFHPEECGGPLDTQFLIQNFISKAEEK